jgi:6,7-dimethyl-8-ribityllumazine synthase
MNQSPILSPTTASQKRIAYIEASWHADILGKGRESFFAEMARRDVLADTIDVFSVPGAYEIPLQAKRLARTGRYQAIVASALVVDGGIYRHDFVASAVLQGMMQVQLETEVPIFSMVLTPHHFHEHETHRAFFCEHFVEKGREVARACLSTVAALKSLDLYAA